MIGSTARPVVVGVDGLPGSAGALRYAVAEARRRGAPLRLVHVVPDFIRLGPPIPMADVRRHGRAVLAEALETARAADPSVAVDSVLALGERHRGVVDAADGAQLVVVGRETRHGLDRLLVGATTARIASRAPCDVVIVPSFWVAEAPRGRVVVGLKSRENAHELLAGAFAEASVRGAELQVVVAWEVADPYFDRFEVREHADEWEAQGRGLVAEQAEPWRTAYPDVAVDTRVVHGPAARVLLAAGADGDLLVLSRRRLAVPPHGHLGGVARAVLRLSEVPVHVVPCTEHPGGDFADLVLESAGAPVV